MNYQRFKLKRIKKKSELPEREKIYRINNVFLNGQKTLIYVNGGDQWVHRKHLYLYNTITDKWYEVINEVR